MNRAIDGRGRSEPAAPIRPAPPARRTAQRRAEILIGRYTVNPLVRGLFRVGLTPPRMALLETVGRKTGKVRVVPVGYIRDGRTLWVIAQHGRGSGWVHNIEARPRVRLRIGRTWHTGAAYLVPDDDVRARMAGFASGPVGRTLATAVYQALETDPVSVRVDLDG